MIKHERSFAGAGSSRYDLDAKLGAKGYVQLATSGDAWYYGNWVDATTRTLVSFAEGDLCESRCCCDIEFAAEVRRVAEWYRKRGDWIGIDTIDGEKIAAFEKLGLDDLIPRATEHDRSAVGAGAVA